MISENEFQILKLLWKEGRPLSRSEILKGTDGIRSWNPASIHLILNSMISKKILRIVDEDRKYARKYAAAIDRNDYLFLVLMHAFPGENPNSILSEWRREHE